MLEMCEENHQRIAFVPQTENPPDSACPLCWALKRREDTQRFVDVLKERLAAYGRCFQLATDALADSKEGS